MDISIWYLLAWIVVVTDCVRTASLKNNQTPAKRHFPCTAHCTVNSSKIGIIFNLSSCQHKKGTPCEMEAPSEAKTSLKTYRTPPRNLTKKEKRNYNFPNWKICVFHWLMISLQCIHPSLCRLFPTKVR